MLGRLWGWFTSGLRVKYREYRRTWWWLVVCLVAGVGLAVVSLLIANPDVDDINTSLLDGNVLNMASIDASIGGFIWQRVLSVLLPVVVVLVAAALSAWMAWLLFPLVLMHGYWVCFTLWWTFMYYSISAILLLVFYVVWLVVVTLVLGVGVIWASQVGAGLRVCRGRGKAGWLAVVQGLAVLVLTLVVLGVVEYLIFYLILGRIVYKPL